MTYIFDPDAVHECAMVAVGQPKPQMFDAFAQAMQEKYRGRLDLDQPWIYSNAGGSMIQMKVYYASIMEYIMVWGTPIGSEGHSGRHAVGFWDTVLDGEMWYYGEGQFEKKVYRPGDRVYVGPGQARAMNFTTGVWAVEYARGPLPLSIPFGLADELLSTLDWSTAARTIGVYTTLVGRHLTQPDPDGAHAPSLRRTLGELVAMIGRGLTRAASPPPVDDTIPADRGPSDRGPSDRGPSDRGPSDRGPSDRDQPPAG